MISNAQKLRGDLSEWYRLYTSTDNGLRNPTRLNVSTVSDDYPFHSIYIYKDVLSASIITTYYAYLIVLSKGLNSLQPDGSYAGENFELARAICMSVDYCSHAGFCGIQTMRFSLPVAHSALPVKYQGWVEAWTRRVSVSLGPTMIQAL